eukprot:PLAT11685.12.p2 GENE.PLAT11685.12~~PLAT11685.12.p2  ORF type:complete len:116 (+),score=10.29 PLAT11685.12:298-645(+)
MQLPALHVCLWEHSAPCTCNDKPCTWQRLLSDRRLQSSNLVVWQKTCIKSQLTQLGKGARAGQQHLHNTILITQPAKINRLHLQRMCCHGFHKGQRSCTTGNRQRLQWVARDSGR